MALKLSYKIYGKINQKTPIVILHGLFGSKQNWASISKQLSRSLDTLVIPVDLRNHGESPHSHVHDYTSMVEDLKLLIDTEFPFKNVNVIGHSMGGKTAMYLAWKYPELLNNLVVVDMAPGMQSASSTSNLSKYLDLMKEIVHLNITNPKEYLKERIADESLVAFILTNWKSGKFRINVDALSNSLVNLSEFPVFQSNINTLFIKGTRSDYIPSDCKICKQYFPNSKLTSIDAGHWVHSDSPAKFLNVVQTFLRY